MWTADHAFDKMRISMQTKVPNLNPDPNSIAHILIKGTIGFLIQVHVTAPYNSYW